LDLEAEPEDQDAERERDRCERPAGQAEEALDAVLRAVRILPYDVDQDDDHDEQHQQDEVGPHLVLVLAHELVLGLLVSHGTDVTADRVQSPSPSRSTPATSTYQLQLRALEQHPARRGQ